LGAWKPSTPCAVWSCCLQVVWVIGLSMLVLAALVHLPRGLLIARGVVIVLGHGIGPWFAAEGATRPRRLVTLRALNMYGDQPCTM